MRVNTIANRQHALTSALKLPSSRTIKVDHYNLVVHMADYKSRFLPMHDYFYNCGDIFQPQKRSSWMEMGIMR